MILAEDERGLEIGRVELVRDAEAKRSELSALVHNGVHEADGEDDVSPLLIWLDLLEEVLSDQGRVGTGHTSSDTLRRLSGDLDGHLEETEREASVRLASDPETELLVDLLALGVEDFFHLSHELEGQVTIVKDNPETITEGIIDVLFGNDFLLLSHGYLLGWDSLLSGQLIDGIGGVGTRSEQVEHRLAWLGLIVHLSDLIGDWCHEVLAEHAADELLGSEHSSVLTDGPDEAEMEEVTNGLGIHLVLVLGNGHVLGRVLIQVLLPLLLVALNLVNDILIEARWLVVEFVLRQGDNVEPHLLVHPVELLIPVVDTRAGLEKHVHIALVKHACLDQDLQAHHELEGDLISFEETSIDVSVHLVGHAVNNVGNTVLNELGLGRLVNTIIEQIEELLQRGVVHPVDKGHLDDAEVKDGTTRSDGSERLTLLTNFSGLLTSLNKLLSNFARLELDFSQHINELFIIEQVAIGGGESLEQRLIVVSKDLSVVGNILVQLLELIFEMLLLL